MPITIDAPWPIMDEELVRAVAAVMRSGKLNQWTGTQVYAFEREYARYVGVRYAVAMANGSVTLDTALSALRIGPGDEVVVTSRSFVASASCVALTGALPVFADIEESSGNVTARSIAAVLTARTKAVIVVHLAGWPCEMDEIAALCRRKKLYLIEDCAQAHGARYKGRPVGSFGQFGSFSFCQDKIITTGGEGGMLVTNDKALWSKVWSAKDHGRDYNAVVKQKSGTSFKWMVKSFGTNYRLTELQAAIGRIMLSRLDAMVAARRARAQQYNAAFAAVPGLCVYEPPAHSYHAYYKYYVHVQPELLRADWSRDRILQELSAQGIACGCGACPEIYRELAFRRQRKTLGLPAQRRLPSARKLGARTVMLTVHPSLQPEHISAVIAALRRIMRQAVSVR